MLGPGGQAEGEESIEIVGLAEGAQLQVTPTVFVEWSDYVNAVKSSNPSAGGVLPSAIGASPAEGLDAATLAERINDRSLEADALTR